MKILLDGDSCDVRRRTEPIAMEHGIDCHWYRTRTQGARVKNGYSVYHLIDPGPDAVDFAIANDCGPGDIVVTRDGGLAAMAMAKRAWAIHPHGGEYTEYNIQQTLTARYVHKRNRRGRAARAINGSPACNPVRYEDVLLDVIRRAAGTDQR